MLYDVCVAFYHDGQDDAAILYNNNTGAWDYENCADDDVQIRTMTEDEVTLWPCVDERMT